MEEQLWPQTGC
jgi:hypothetical protein